MSSTDELMRSDAARTGTTNPRDSYDGSQTIYRLMRLATWGSPLMNLGYFRFRGPLKFLNMFRKLEFAQHQLVTKSAGLLGIQGGQRVLDLACGRGKSSFIIQCLNPEASVVGVDLLERHTMVAETLYANARNLSYATGNAMQLDFPAESFDRIRCFGHSRPMTGNPSLRKSRGTDTFSSIRNTWRSCFKSLDANTVRDLPIPAVTAKVSQRSRRSITTD